MSKITKIIIFLILYTQCAYSQIAYREDVLNIVRSGESVEIDFSAMKKDVFVASVTDANSGQSYDFLSEKKSIKIFFVRHGRILKVDFFSLNGTDTLKESKFIATPSASTGEIKVYFNHDVDNSYKQNVEAINLSNHLVDTLISYINRCEKTLDITIYNSYSPSSSEGIAGAINAAYSRGVKVRIIYDGSTGSIMIGYLDIAIPRVASPTTSAYGLMHNKFVIFDAEDSNPDKAIVWTGSTNWTAAQIDGPDKNNVIIIQDQALALAFQLEFEEMWGDTGVTANSTNAKFGKYKTNNTPHNFSIGGKVVECYFSPSDGTNSKIISAIISANSDVNIATMLITRTDISQELLNKKNSGVSNINIVADNQSPSGTQIPTLQSDMLPNHVVLCPLSGQMHHKFMVVDNFNSASDPMVVTGSHNWSNAAETKNDENTLIVHDAGIADQYYQAFAYLYKQAGGEIIMSMDNLPEKTSVDFYPNPSNGIINFKYKENQTVEIYIYDVSGKLLQKEFILFDGYINMKSYQSGIYFLEIKHSGNSDFIKVVKY